ncbi:MAG: Maf family protein, partial [Anaerolineaceae bacterium]|nr:Maf family protein [Anaerolineaceae bacterium]
LPAPELILASTSPRRRQLLALGGWSFAILPANLDETRLPAEPPSAYVSRLALAKAQAARLQVADEFPTLPVVASDTAVVLDDQILGKPADAQDAVRMLRQLRGRTHQVFTALALLDPRSGETLQDVCITGVLMRAYTDEDIQAYVASGDPFDKAGAYAIQHAQFHPVERLRGCYPSVMGLPLCLLTRLLLQVGLPPRSDVTRSCQRNPDEACDVYLLSKEAHP